MANKTDPNIVDEVEKRLDDLFGEGEDSPEFEEDTSTLEDAPAFEEDIKDVEDTPIKGLKSAVLSIEWEISDETMNRFLDQVDNLKEPYQNDKIVQMFLQLLATVGKYIKAKKANADPDVVKLLNSAYAGLEKIIVTHGITEAERKKVLLVEMDKFKGLKERLAAKRSAAEKGGGVKAPKEVPAAEVPEKTIEEMAEEKPEGKVEPEEAVVEAKEKEKKISVHIPAVKKAGSKGLGLAGTMGLMVLVPLVIIACFNYIYVNQMTAIPSLINQVLQTYMGMTIDGARTTVFGLSGCLIVLIGLIAYIRGRNTAVKIKSLTSVIEQLAEGRMDVVIDLKEEGEIGALAEAVRHIKDKIG
ncbi:hypothetical protein PITCH_A1150068 [uncultured Desulfobacterium sp.]|uniref:HAMP domain-containing protein n=1 Tax=uncultured Desulfobacterium sp. TaxID=201089 RepID=A0A445MRF4_9BACT|nr:hypothetical protein PITCH_A1150068 [uncultured Desulfobacterium sp.]